MSTGPFKLREFPRRFFDRFRPRRNPAQGAGTPDAGDVRFDLSAMPDFEAVNAIIAAIFTTTLVIVGVLWWKLLV